MIAEYILIYHRNKIKTKPTLALQVVRAMTHKLYM